MKYFTMLILKNSAHADRVPLSLCQHTFVIVAPPNIVMGGYLSTKVSAKLYSAVCWVPFLGGVDYKPKKSKNLKILSFP
jgi:hypothetical protein